MIEKIAFKSTEILIENKIIAKEDKGIYVYGFETLSYFIINILISLSLGFVFNKFLHTLIFLSCYCTIRQFSGGYHAKNYKSCIATFTFINLITFFVTTSTSLIDYKYLVIFIGILSSLIIIFLSPVENRNNTLSNLEKIYYKKVTTILSLVVCIFSSISMLINIYNKYMIYCIFALFWIALLQILAILKDKINRIS